MAVDMFLKLAGIDGESRDAGHENEIDVLAWSWGASNAGSLQVRGGNRAAPSFQDLSITKWIDRSSEDLLRLVATGAQVADAQLTIRKAGENPLDYVVIRFKPVLVTSVSTGGSGGEDRLTENISLNFAKYEFVYTPQTEKGSGAPERFAWDIQAAMEIPGSF